MESLEDHFAVLGVEISKIQDWDWEKVVYFLDQTPSLVKPHILDVIVQSDNKPKGQLTFELIKRILLLSQKELSINETTNALLINKLLPYAKLNGEHLEEILLWFHTQGPQRAVIKSFSDNKDNSLDIDSLLRIFSLIKDQRIRGKACILLIDFVLPIKDVKQFLGTCLENLDDDHFVKVFKRIYKDGTDMDVMTLRIMRSKLLREYQLTMTIFWLETVTIKITSMDLTNILAIWSDNYSRNALTQRAKDRKILMTW